jgi:hypothetical protein
MPPAGRRTADDNGRPAEGFVLEHLRAMNVVERRWFGRVQEAIRSSPPSLTFPIDTEIPEALLKAEAGVAPGHPARSRRVLHRARRPEGAAPGLTDPPTFDPATTSVGKVIADRDGGVRAQTTEGTLATPHVYTLVIIDGSWRIDDRVSSPGRGVRSFSSL